MDAKNKALEAAKLAADHHTTLCQFAAIAAIARGSDLHYSAQRTGERIAALCFAEQKRQLKKYDAALAVVAAGVPASESCPRGTGRPEPTCTNRHQCWEPCGELGHSAEHARVAYRWTRTAKAPHEQAMAGYAVACKYGVFEAQAFALADEMYAAMLQIEGGARWQPIATAPKDGTHILACDVTSSFGWTGGKPLPPVQTTVHYWPHGDKPGFYTSVNEREPMQPFGATHWKPLDAPGVPGTDGGQHG